MCPLVSVFPFEERCLQRTFPGETIRTISRRRPASPDRVRSGGGQEWRSHRACAARSVLDGPRSGREPRGWTGRNPRRLADRAGVRVVTSQAAPAVEDRQRAVRITVHFHRCLHEVRTQRAFRNLRLAVLERNAIVVAHHALFLDAERLCQFQSGRRDKRAARLFRRDGEPCVVRRYISVPQPGVRSLHGRNPRQQQILLQTIL